MEVERYYFVDVLFLLFGIALIIIAIKYPKQIFIKLPLAILSLPFRSSWITSAFMDLVAGDHEDDRPYRSTRNLNVEFQHGEKYVYVLSSSKDVRVLIEEFLDALKGNYRFDEFKIVENGEQRIVQFPSRITFFDFHLFVQHLTEELEEKKSFGVFKSAKLNYYVFKDRATLNNLIGFTSNKKLFSIYMLADLETKQQLRLNQKLKVETEWIEQVLLTQ